MPILTTETVNLKLADVRVAAEQLGLDVVDEMYAGRHESTCVVLGTVIVSAFDAPRWRDLGEGPSWQEQYMLSEDVTAPIRWYPARDGAFEVTASFPVMSLLRQGGAKWGGVSIVARDDTDPKPSTHTRYTYGYDAWSQLGRTGTLFGSEATLAPGVSFREIPYKHDPSKLHWVVDLG